MKVVVPCLVLLSIAAARAEDLGIKNRGYGVDLDAREQMRNLMREKARNGEIDRHLRDYRAKAVDAIRNPKPLGVPTSAVARTERHDLRFVLPQDYRDQNGRVVARKGTVIEPLKLQPLIWGLVFIDGRDQRQVDYAISQGRKKKLKIVLTAGSFTTLREKYKDHIWHGSRTIPFYFDQRKMIITQLQQLYGVKIASVPAMVTQQGTQLQVDFGMQK